MNNQELELKIKEILNTSNYFDMMVKCVNFEKEYKQSDFYKITHQTLFDVIKQAKLWYLTQFESVSNHLQTILNNLDLTNFQASLDRIGDVFGQENAEITEMLDSLKDIVK